MHPLRTALSRNFPVHGPRNGGQLSQVGSMSGTFALDCATAGSERRNEDPTSEQRAVGSDGDGWFGVAV